VNLVVPVLPDTQESDGDELVDPTLPFAKGALYPGTLDDAVELLCPGVGQATQPGSRARFEILGALETVVVGKVAIDTHIGFRSSDTHDISPMLGATSDVVDGDTC
jgi:hypothetical protein